MNKQISKKISECYYRNYRFPDWTIDALSDNLCKQSMVYYDSGAKLSDVMRLVTEREPVNIGMSRLYDPDHLEKHFGYRTGAYGDLSSKCLPPNIAIYNYTPVDVGKKEKPIIHVINCIGYAFDDRSQPDYKYFMRTITDPEERRLLMIQKYKDIFAKVWRCAIDHGLTTVVMSLVGGGVFSGLYNDDLKIGLQKSVWVPAFMQSLTPQVLKNIKIKFMGAKNSDAFKKIQKQIKIEDTGYFPGNVEHLDTEKTLFVNAWDPWSMAGNGNAGDNSLDGYVGRSTMIGLLSWSNTNEYLKEKENYLEM